MSGTFEGTVVGPGASRVTRYHSSSDSPAASSARASARQRLKAVVASRS
jgi:hypothetical protein